MPLFFRAIGEYSEIADINERSIDLIAHKAAKKFLKMS